MKYCFIVMTFTVCQVKAQSNLELILGGKARHNFHNQTEVALVNNDIINYSKELFPYNSVDAIVEIGLIYRLKQNYFIEGRASFGSNSYKYIYGKNLSTLGYGGIYHGLPLGLLNIQSNPAIWFKLNGGYSFSFNKIVLDLGVGVIWKPALESGSTTRTEGVSIKLANRLKKVVTAQLYPLQTSHIYQNCYARFFIQDSKYRLLNHMGLELAYTNKLIGRFRKSVMDVTYLDSENRTFVNEYYDFQRSIALSFLYRF